MLGLCLVTAMLMMLGMVSPQTVGDAEWNTAAPLGGSATVQSVDFVDETVGYAARGSSGVMRTTDGGRSWEDVTPWTVANASVEIQDVHFLDAATGWAVGEYSWEPFIIIPFEAGVAPAADREYLSAIYFTEDAGETWTRQTISGDPEHSLNAISFYGDAYGMAVGDNQTVAVTRDGGATWTTRVDGDMPNDINDVFMISSTTAQIVGDAGLLGEWKYNMPIIIPGVAPVVGPFWSYDAQISTTGADITGITFTDADHGFATCEEKYILRTNNGGDTWSKASWSVNPTLYGSTQDIQFLDATHGWAVGYSRPFLGVETGLILRTIDGGASWVSERSATGAELYTIDKVSESCGWAMGEAGVAYKYGATNSDRLSGANRYDTAMEISADAFSDNSSDYVVVATGANFADALSAAGLAGAYECPLLLTGSTLTTELTDEIDRVGASNVVLIGGTAAIPQVVEDDLTDAGYNVDRHWGVNRYDTAVKVGEVVADVMGAGFGQKVIVARGDNFADALAISPFAYSQKMPVLLVRPTSIPAETQSAFVDLVAREAILVGGTVAISQDVQDDIDVLLDDNSGLASERWSGANRYATAAAIAENGLSEGYGDASYIGVATGVNFPDALGGGVACGRRGGVLLLTAPTALSPEVETFITENKQFDTSVRVFGGEGAVDADVLVSIQVLL